MGILNTTPDSFSDGGKNAQLDIAIANALKMVQEGVDIIDIGGVSTRPGAIAPDIEEEWKRVVPVIQAIRGHEDEKLKNVIISVDTYRAKIALDSIRAGANIINDISGGLYDPEMFSVVAETGVPYVLNHTRGTPDTMASLNQYTANDDANVIEYVRCYEKFQEDEEILLKAVSRELCAQYQKAIESGVKRWQIITDPGIGFAKDLKQNLALIRGTPLIKTYSNYNETTNQFNSLEGLPILLGPSRKKFIGTLTNEKNPTERVLTTGAVIMSCVGYKGDIVRVHDVDEMKKVLLIGDALYRDIL
jgi:dihydroneopterin aldolase/2-amino-4-hydroxy-6-hydroxymethyldihydropteridine diphosphokinase/dihydropteroate synthase